MDVIYGHCNVTKSPIGAIEYCKSLFVLSLLVPPNSQNCFTVSKTLKRFNTLPSTAVEQLTFQSYRKRFPAIHESIIPTVLKAGLTSLRLLKK